MPLKSSSLQGKINPIWVIHPSLPIGNFGNFAPLSWKIAGRQLDDITSDIFCGYFEETVKLLPNMVYPNEIMFDTQKAKSKKSNELGSNILKECQYILTEWDTLARIKFSFWKLLATLSIFGQYFVCWQLLTALIKFWPLSLTFCHFSPLLANIFTF